MRLDEREIRSSIQSAHERRGRIWQERDADGYLAYYWDDAVLVADGNRIAIPAFREWVQATFNAGGGSLDFHLPTLEDIEVSPLGDAVTTTFEWRQRFRTAEGEISDRSCIETNVWYRRSESWKIIRLHLTTITKTVIS